MMLPANSGLQFRMISALLLAAAVAVYGGVELPECTDKKIYILDLNAFAGNNIPYCNLDQIAGANPSNGVLYLRPQNSTDPYQTGLVSHKYGMHSGPLYAMEAIRGSQYVTDNIDEADIVYINDYCFYMWYLAWVHTKGRAIKETPGDHLVAAYAELVKTPRYKQYQGRDFVFYDPHPGYAAGNAENPYMWDYLCDAFKHSTHIIVERGQRNRCPTYWEMEKKLLIAPYMPNSADMDTQYATWEVPLRPLAERSLLLYTKTRCSGWSINGTGHILNPGKKMRYDIARALGNASPDVEVECTDEEYGQRHVSFADMLHEMQNSKFCLAMPGDSQSSRRMSEIFMAGCIPVYAGPPFATMPFPEDVNYRQVALMYNVTQYHSWLTQDFNWNIHPTLRVGSQVASFWTADAELETVASINTLTDLVSQLKDISTEKVETMFSWMESQRQMFVFYPHITEKKTAVNTIISRICRIASAQQEVKDQVDQRRKNRRFARLSRSLITDGDALAASPAATYLQPLWVK